MRIAWRIAAVPFGLLVVVAGFELLAFGLFFAAGAAEGPGPHRWDDRPYVSTWSDVLTSGIWALCVLTLAMTLLVTGVSLMAVRLPPIVRRHPVSFAGVVALSACVIGLEVLVSSLAAS